MSPQLREVRAAGEEALGRKSQPWRIRPDDFFTASEALRALFAQLIQRATWRAWRWCPR